MTYVNNPNDPSYVVPGTVAPQVEAVEPVKSPLTWLWWVLGALVLAGLVFALVRACNLTHDCTTLPANVWTETQRTTTWNTLVGYDPNHFTTENQSAVIGELETLCNRRLGGGTIAIADITGANVFAGLEENAASQVLSLVNGTSFCRCH